MNCRLVILQVMITLKIYVYAVTRLGKLDDLNVSVKGVVPMSVETFILDSSNAKVFKSEDRLIYAASGVNVAIIGQMIVLCAC